MWRSYVLQSPLSPSTGSSRGQQSMLGRMIMWLCESWTTFPITSPCTGNFTFLVLRRAIRLIHWLYTLNWCCMDFQARSQTVQDMLGRRTSIYNAMSDSARTELRPQLHGHWSKRNSVLACPHNLAPSHSPRPHCHLAQERDTLPFP